MTNSGDIIWLDSFYHNKGRYPMAGLIVDTSGDLFGTTSAGGKSDVGVLFELGAEGHEAVLADFGVGNQNQSTNPDSGLIIDSSGRMF